MNKKRIGPVALLIVFLLITLFISPRSAHAESDPDLNKWENDFPLQYGDWQDSVHGAAFLAGDPNAPNCTGCHNDPAGDEFLTAAGRLEIPERCASCHADEEKMNSYRLSADVYDTYLADFHGTTIAFYRSQKEAEWRYEAVCSDCHENHAVFNQDDPRSTVSASNLPSTCRQCHAEAPANFNTAGHYRTSGR
ncbi:MAG: cytochrome c3 family protein, partial [Anaerolineales bacterium]|nr:cytochrome c3 family protein [Anaerolineales bacterium]